MHHQCGICKEFLLLDVLEIGRHLKKSRHGISHKKYNARYMTYKIGLRPVKIEEVSEDKPMEEKTNLYKVKYKKEEFKMSKSMMLYPSLNWMDHR